MSGVIILASHNLLTLSIAKASLALHSLNRRVYGNLVDYRPIIN